MTAPALARRDLTTFLDQRRPFGRRQRFKPKLRLSCARGGRKRDERQGHERNGLQHKANVRDGSVTALILRKGPLPANSGSTASAGRRRLKARAPTRQSAGLFPYSVIPTTRCMDRRRPAGMAGAWREQCRRGAGGPCRRTGWFAGKRQTSAPGPKADVWHLTCRSAGRCCCRLLLMTAFGDAAP